VSAIVVFPGQGAQRNGMAEDFHAAHAEARRVFEEASEVLDLDMAALCFGADERLNLTEYTQPAILTAEIAMFRVLTAHFGVEVSFYGGHSLGEYTALVAAGVIPLADGLRVVRERGRRMQVAVPAGEGAMAAIIQADLSLEDIGTALDGLTVDIANHNALNQVVISGQAADVDTAVSRYQASPAGARARIRMLTVSAPFHSRLMAPIERGFRTLLSEVSTGWDVAKSAQVASNTTGGLHDGTQTRLLDNLTRQISGTVRWVDNMHTLLSAAPDRVVEIGPGRPLRGFFRGLGDALGDRPLDAVTNLASAQHAFGE
jgi:[acyl-carrier-protein] S-malonyltransferase